MFLKINIIKKKVKETNSPEAFSFKTGLSANSALTALVVPVCAMSPNELGYVGNVDIIVTKKEYPVA